MRKALTLLVVIAIAATLVVAGWRLSRGARPTELTLYFHPFVGSDPLVLNESSYPNPGGEGRFRVRDFLLFVSNIRLVGASGEFVEPDSYHLVRFDGEEPVFAIVLPDVPRRDYERIELGIGVDGSANGSLESRGDLDPNGRMAWTWEVGYKFVLFEGALEHGEERIPLVYHVGFTENYKPVSIGLHDTPRDLPARLDFRVDVLRLFQGATTIDMAALPDVKFDKADSARIADNFAGMVTPMWPGAAGQPIEEGD